MVQSRIRLRQPKRWELLALIFACLAVIKDIPWILRTLGITRRVPNFIKNILLGCNKNSDFWIIIFFIILIGIIYFFYIIRDNHYQGENENKDKEISALKILKKERLLRIFRSFFLIYFREKILDFMGVGMYGTFNKKDQQWDIDILRYDYVDRILFTNKKGIEFQYSKDFCLLQIREHDEKSIQYGETKYKKPDCKDIKLLFVASDFFPFWIIIHLIKRIFCKCKNS